MSAVMNIYCWLQPLVTYLIICLPGHSQAGSRNIIQLTRMECSDTPVLRVAASIDPYEPPPLTAINLQANLSKNLTDLRINGVFTIRSKNGAMETALLNRTISACTFYKHPSQNRLLQIIQQELIQHSNLPTKCPILSTRFFIRNASFTNARVPSFLPATHFRVDVNLLDGTAEKVIFSSRWYGMFRKMKGP